MTSSPVASSPMTIQQENIDNPFESSLQLTQKGYQIFKKVQQKFEDAYSSVESRVYRWLPAETAYNAMNYLRALALIPITLPLSTRFHLIGAAFGGGYLWMNAPQRIEQAPWIIKLVNSIALNTLFTGVIALAKGGGLAMVEEIGTSTLITCAALFTAGHLEKIYREQQKQKQEEAAKVQQQRPETEQQQVVE